MKPKALHFFWGLLGILSVGLFGQTHMAFSAPENNPLTLTILHTNDIHSNYGGFTKDRQICYQALCPGGSGGSLRLERVILALKTIYPQALLVNAGDEFQGTLFWRIHKQAATTAVLNILGYQYFVPGNHEFDDGIRTFKILVNDLKAQVLAANLILSDPLTNPKKLAPTAIKVIDGRKIGLIGLTTADLENPDERHDPQNKSLAVSEEKKALTEAVDSLTKQGADIIVAITHIGLNRDLEMAGQVDGLDIVVGGHSHSLLGDKLPRSQGPYPTVVTSPSGHPVLVVTAGSQGNYLGLLTVDFDEKGYPVKWSGQPYPIDDQTLNSLNAPPASPALANILNALAIPIENLLGEKIGQINGSGQVLEDNFHDCRQNECRSGNIIAQAFLSYFPQAQIALINGGAIRQSLPTGEISIGNVLAALPFENYVYSADISGTTLLKVLEHSVENHNRGHMGKFLQMGGLKVTYAEKDAKFRVKEALFWDGSAWVPVAPNASYRLVTVDYLAGGGDGYQMLKELNWTKSDQQEDDLLILYLRKGPIDANIDGRIKFVKE
jgi:5'-nucleotidase